LITKIDPTVNSEYKSGLACGLCCTKLHGFGVMLGKTEILRDLSLHIHCGELTALIGPNGAGKSTLLKAILGEVAHSGTMTFLDIAGAKARTPRIGYVPQRLDFDAGSPTSVLDLWAASTCRRPVWLGAEKKLRAYARSKLAAFNADHLIENKLGSLSGGELQRVLLTLALEPVPDLLLMDEPVSGIDPRGIELFYQMISDLRQQYDMSIILVSHDLGLVSRYSDRIIFLNRTFYVVGTPGEVFSNPTVIQTFGRISTEAGKIL